MPKVTIYTQVYNAGKYLEPCISSVLNQTFRDFEWILVDSHSTDSSASIMGVYAKKDHRIKPVYLAKNDPFAQFRLSEEFATGEYYACLDHDDWWEPNYLERLLDFLDENKLDLAMTGTICHFGNSQSILRKLEWPEVLTLQQFVQLYPQLWAFPSTRWASLMPLGIFLESKTVWEKMESGNGPYYGGDTVQMLACLEKCHRIGIDNTTLYHYRIHTKSQSFQYNFQRFNDNIVCYKSIQNFLQQHNALDSSKNEWLKSVHIHSMLETLRLLKNSRLSTEDKLRECARIVQHPLTSHVLTYEGQETSRWYNSVYEIHREATVKGVKRDDIFSDVFGVIAPQFSDVAGLFARNPQMLDDLSYGRKEALAGKIMALIANRQYTRRYDMVMVFHRVLPNDSPLYIVEDQKFFEKYQIIAQKILTKEYLTALDQMTSLLLSGKKLYGEEVFLQIYLILAAIETQESAFIFGKIRLAELYQRNGQTNACLTLIAELEEMGAGEIREVAKLRAEVQEKTGGEF